MENVWEYPRPPAVDRSPRRVRIEFGGTVIVDSTGALRVLETSHPPTIYVPRDDVAPGVLRDAPGRSTLCEWKGRASYLDVVVGDRVAPAAAWTYRSPSPGYELLQDHVSFYPGRMDSCRLDDEVVRPQPGSFYGGWLTDDIVGAVKGGPGTTGW